MQERMYGAEKRIAMLEMKLAELNGEANKPGCDNACTCEPTVAYFQEGDLYGEHGS